VGARTQLINHVRGATKSFGASFCPSALPEAFTRGPQRAHPRGSPAGLGAYPRAEIGSLTQRIREYERQLEAISEEHYPETDLLRQVEGVGPLTALTFVLTLEDPHRFERSRSVGAYLGLVPATDRSGDREPQKRIFRRRATRC
jgi:transposase